MKLYFVRHGETQMNQERLYYGWLDCPINEKGRTQAEALHQYFQNINYNRVLTSDLKRAKETAEILNKGKAIPIEPKQSLRELHFGAWEGKHYKVLQKEYPEEMIQWGKDWQGFQIPEGESFLTFYERVTKALKEIIAETKEEDTIVLVTHNGVMSAMLCELTGAGYGSFWRFFSEQETYSLVSIRKGNIMIEKINCPVRL